MSVKPSILDALSGRAGSGIVLTRIDNRLVHGQVLEAWVPFVQADCIVVANDAVAGKPLQRKLMAASIPSQIRTIIASVDDAIAFFAAAPENNRILLLFADSADALRGRSGGIPFAELNLGNLHCGDNKRRVSCTIAIDNDDIDNFRKIEAFGVRIVARCIPSDDPRDWKDLCPAPDGA